MKKGKLALTFVLVFSLGLFIGVLVDRTFFPKPLLLPEKTEMISLQTTDKRLDINLATKEQLMVLQGIGEVLAERIITYRTENGPFQAVEELMFVEGIGEKIFEQNKHLIKVGG